MYRQIFIPDEQNNHVSIPRNWYGQEVEVILFLTNETARQTEVKSRRDWAEAARQMHAAGGDALLVPDVFSNEDTDWWTWDE